VEVLDSEGMGLVISIEFVKKHKFKKKLKRPVYTRNIDNVFNHEELIEYTVEVELFYKGYKKRTEIDVIREQKWSVILEMLWLVCHNPEIDWRTKEVKMTRC